MANPCQLQIGTFVFVGQSLYTYTLLFAPPPMFE